MTVANVNWRVGTCSWKFPAWTGLVYSGLPGTEMLAEYAGRYGCVEVDQWYWSLFGVDKVALPRARDVAEYAAAVPDGFRFGVKLPDALTLTHLRPGGRDGPLASNPHFLSPDLLRAFLACLEPLRDKLGPLMLQFGYLNRQMIASQEAFQERLDGFARHLPAGLTWCVETRNPAWLNAAYFRFLKARGLAHVWEQGYHMPQVADVYGKFREELTETCVVRLHGTDREGLERQVGKDWSRIVTPRDGELAALAATVQDMAARGKRAWVFVNNHFEGCAPKTIERLRELIEAGSSGGRL